MEKQSMQNLNTSYKDAQWSQWELQQRDRKHKKELVRSEGYNNRNG